MEAWARRWSSSPPEQGRHRQPSVPRTCRCDPPCGGVVEPRRRAPSGASRTAASRPRQSNAGRTRHSPLLVACCWRLPRGHWWRCYPRQCRCEDWPHVSQMTCFAATVSTPLAPWPPRWPSCHCRRQCPAHHHQVPAFAAPLPRRSAKAPPSRCSWPPSLQRRVCRWVHCAANRGWQIQRLAETCSGNHCSSADNRCQLPMASLADSASHQNQLFTVMHCLTQHLQRPLSAAVGRCQDSHLGCQWVLPGTRAPVRPPAAT